MKVRRHPVLARAVIVALAAILSTLVIAACGGGDSDSDSDSSAAAKSGTLQLWLGGDLTQATPGSPFDEWVKQQINRFRDEYPGWKVETTLLPFDNSQNAAKLQAAFGSKDVPDVMNLYMGQFTTTYADALTSLTDRVQDEEGMFESIPENIWALDCVNYDCEGGEGTILGVPWNSGAYLLFYNKALLEKAGLSEPPATYDDLLAACKTLSAEGILPVSMGAVDGYDTSNMFTTNLVSTLEEGDINALVDGEMPYDDPKLVDALDPILKLTDSSTECTSPDALGQDQLQGTQAFSSGEAAMTPYFGLQLATFQEELGKDLGVARLPVSGDGPLLDVNNGYAGNPFDGWVIPADAPNPDMAWNFIKIASDESANISSQELMGLSPAITEVGEGLSDPLENFAWTLSGDPAIPNLDQVMPGEIANFLYKQFSLGQLGKQSAEETMQAIEEFAQSPVNQQDIP